MMAHGGAVFRCCSLLFFAKDLDIGRYDLVQVNGGPMHLISSNFYAS
jgi:hypothetical protein